MRVEMTDIDYEAGVSTRSAQPDPLGIQKCNAGIREVQTDRERGGHSGKAGADNREVCLLQSAKRIRRRRGRQERVPAARIRLWNRWFGFNHLSDERRRSANGFCNTATAGNDLSREAIRWVCQL